MKLRFIVDEAVRMCRFDEKAREKGIMTEYPRYFQRVYRKRG